MSQNTYNRIKAIMDQQGIKAPTLAKKAGLSGKQAVYDIKKAQKENLLTITKIANALGVKVSEIYKEYKIEEEMKEAKEDSSFYFPSIEKRYIKCLEELSLAKTKIIELQDQLLTLSKSKGHNPTQQDTKKDNATKH